MTDNRRKRDDTGQGPALKRVKVEEEPPSL